MEKIKSPPYLFLLSLILVFGTVLTSGCIYFSGDGTNSYGGVVIEDFETDFQNLYAGENFKLKLRAKNTGSVDAYNVQTKIFNTQATGNNQMLTINCEDVRPCTIGELLAPDPDMGTTGGVLTCTWDCVAPSVDKGISVAFNPSARLSYDYRTNVIKSIVIASQDELRRLKNQGSSPPTETISSTSGPIAVDVTAKGPIRYWEDLGRIRFPVEVKITNNGGGTSCYPDCENPENWNNVKLELPEIVDMGECSGIKGGEVELWKGQEVTVSCEATIETGTNDRGAGIVEKSMDFKATYSYFKDATTGVSVKGREEAEYT